ncbi:MAG: BBP7 family outer membrane beta-barrel protein [Planctomycetia bacterium]|nr:BBP7 family outer membrane beta-barrel protein [Planctomycetia bacterium]
MRWTIAIKVQALLLVLLSAGVVGADDAAPYFEGPVVDNGYYTGNCGGDCGLVCVCQPETYYSIGANFLLLGRNKAQDNPLIGFPANAPTTRLLGAAEMEFNVEAGVDLAFRVKRPSGRSWELRYFGLYDQQGLERRTYDDGDVDPTNDATIVHLGSFYGSYTDLTTDYSADLHSGELNLWLTPWWRLEPVVGLRWMRQSEELETFVTTDFGEGALIEFANNMYGAQAGFRTILWEAPPCFRLEAMLKCGAFMNDTRLDGQTRAGGIVTTTPGTSFTTTSYVGELMISAVYQLTPYFSVRVGYNGLWLDRVGLAADQLDESFLAPGTTDLTTLIYQGGHLGLECAW